MDQNKVFCEECRKDVNFFVKEKKMKGRIKEKTYFYNGKEAHCKECGFPIYVACIQDFNLDQLYETYQKENSILSQKTESLPYGKSNIDRVVEYLLNKCEDITPLALQKALYYIQGFYYAFYRRFLFTEECEAWVHGPVYYSIYTRYRDYRFDPIAKNHEFDDSIFSTEEKEVFDSVIRNVCCYSGKVLESFTHSETPWLSARRGISANEASDRPIAKECIGNYFCKVKEDYHMTNPNDIKSYTEKLFSQLM